MCGAAARRAAAPTPAHAADTPALAVAAVARAAAAVPAPAPRAAAPAATAAGGGPADVVAAALAAASSGASADGGSECPICSDALRSGLGVAGRCGHVFHLPCISRWSAVKRECPVCKGPVQIVKLFLTVADAASGLSDPPLWAPAGASGGSGGGGGDSLHTDVMLQEAQQVPARRLAVVRAAYASRR